MTGRRLDVTSATNPRIKALVDLRKRRTRDESGLAVVEGYDEVVLALRAGARFRELYVCMDLESDIDRLGLVDDVLARSVDVVECSRAAFTRASYRESPDGWLATAENPTRDLDAIVLPSDPLVLVCEGIEKPGNLGAMLRTADAAGVDAVIAADAVTDWANPNTVRASKGTVFSMQVATAATAEVQAWIADSGLRVVVATPDAVTALTDSDLRGPIAVVVGAEHSGVAASWLDRAELALTIPMHGQVNSLNVSVSAAIVLYEALRQRPA